MSASETGFSPSSPPDTGRRCPWPSGEPPKFNHTNQHTQRLASFRVVAGAPATHPRRQGLLPPDRGLSGPRRRAARQIRGAVEGRGLHAAHP